MPWHVEALAIAIAAYALSPIDLIPDFIPVIGLLDEVILLPLAMSGIMRLIPPSILNDHRAKAEALAEKPVSKTAATAIVGIWIATALLIAGQPSDEPMGMVIQTDPPLSSEVPHSPQ